MHTARSCYLDYTDLKLANAQQITVMDGFFLGGAQVVFAAPKAGSAVQAVTLAGAYVWRVYRCLPLLHPFPPPQPTA